MTDGALLELHRERVRPEWIDYNGHLNEAYYLLVFSHATDAFMDFIGLDDAERRRTNRSVYTLETRISYIDEVGEGAEVRVTAQLLDFDEKRFHLYQVMYDGERLLSEMECMLLNVDMAGPRAAPFAPEVSARLREISEAQATLPRPERAGRSIGIRRQTKD